MCFQLPKYIEPDFSALKYQNAPDIRVAAAMMDGVAPQGFHSTSIYPEYFKIDGRWYLAAESRMDAVVVVRDRCKLEVMEARYIKRGDLVVLGRSENGEEGIYLHTKGFEQNAKVKDQFVFRVGRSRETAFSRDYDQLYQLLEHERSHGKIVWVLGPAISFDYNSREAMQLLIENGYVHGLLAGNALATHDLEGGYFRTALGQDIYTQESKLSGHYHHLDIINLVRQYGSVSRFIHEKNIGDGIMQAVIAKNIPFVLAGSIRDDGPLPEVVSDVYEAQKRMRAIMKTCTTVICLATQLHTIAAGNMTPSFRVVDGKVRPLYIYTVDISEFVTNKLLDRGSLSAVSMVTNAQDFIVNVAKGVNVYKNTPVAD